MPAGLYERTAQIRARQSAANRRINVGYFALHYRVYKARGRASEHRCICGKPAKEWAHLHATDPYDPVNYNAMCLSCHARYDSKERSFK